MTVLPKLAARPDTLTHVVLEAIRSAIVNQELPAGARVTEAGLARQLNVSKTPVREALLQLREIGLIEADERRGGRILSPSRSTISDAYEVREALEVFAAGAAATRSDDRSIRRIYRTADRSLAPPAPAISRSSRVSTTNSIARSHPARATSVSSSPSNAHSRW